MKEATLAEATHLFLQLPLLKRIATLSSEYAYVDAARDHRLEPVYLVYERGNKFWMQSVLQGHVPNSDYIDYESPYGYGGPVSNTDDQEFLEQAKIAYLIWCEDHGVIAEFVRLHPMIDQPFFGEKRYNREAVYLAPDKDYPATCRNMIRKATKEGLVSLHAPQSHILNFAKSYRDHMRHLGASDFYFFSDKYFETLSRWHAAHLIVVEQDQEWLSAGIFLEGGTFFEYHLSITTERGRKLAATNKLIDAAHNVAGNRGKGLFLGGGKTTHKSDPLLGFKSSFGGRLVGFSVGSLIHRADVYYAMQEEYLEVGNVDSRTLFWR